MILLKDKNLDNIRITTYICSKTNKVLAVKRFSIKSCQLAPRNSSNNSNDNDYNLDNTNVNDSQPESLDHNSPSSSEGDGYETDSDRSRFEEGADTMADYSPRDLPDDHLRRYIRDTGDIKRNPEKAGIEGDNSDDEELRQFWAQRNEELRAELKSRKEKGVIPDSPSEHEDSSTSLESSQQDGASNRPDSGTAPTDGGTSSGLGSSTAVGANDTNTAKPSSNKRMFEEVQDEDSSSQPSKRFKQDSSDVTGDTEPAEYGWGEED
jgi:hypothetical protein